MAKRFDECLKDYEKAQSDKIRLQKEIDDLKARKVELTDQAEKAAEVGDDAAFLRFRSEANRIDDVIYVRGKQLQKAGAPINKEDAIAAWDNYVRPYNKQIGKALEGYQNARKELFKQLRELIDLNNKILADRVCIGRAAGLDPDPYSGGGDQLSEFNVETISSKDIHKDVEFFISLGEIDRRAAANFGAMLNTKRPM